MKTLNNIAMRQKYMKSGKVLHTIAVGSLAEEESGPSYWKRANGWITPSKRAVMSYKKRVLVMDDEEMILGVVEALLSNVGYESTTAQTGEEAVSLYKEAMDLDEPFCAVILDLEIFNGKGGKETIQELLSIDPDVKAILSTGSLHDPIITDYKNYGFLEILTKPYGANELYEKLRGIIVDPDNRL
jgi:CheY-like chemotaxis protein